MSQDLTKAHENDQYLTLKEKLALRRQPSNIDALLLDCSSSMNLDVEPGKSRYAALLDILSNVRFNGRVFWFNSYWEELHDKPITPPAPSGDTHLASLLAYIKQEGCKSCLIITDGEINDKAGTRMCLASEPKINIKVMFVGTNKPAFLDELATDGNATVEDLSQPKQLAEKIQLLLTAGTGEAGRKGPIEL
jgi:hypothetical protein